MAAWYLRILVFVSGMTVMAVELTGLRLLAPFFGTSMIVTTILIGSMMGFLSLGYWIGGNWGDRYPRIETLAKITGAAGVLVVVLPFISYPILRVAASTVRPLLTGSTLSEPVVAMAVIIGGLLGILVLFALPVTLMGMTSPWAVRLAVRDVEDAGKAAGRLYSLSTVGSIIGSFLPALVLVPLMGVRNTFILVGAILTAVSAIRAFGGIRRGVPSVAVFGLLFVPQGLIAPTEGLVHEEESLYHHIQVVEKKPSSPKCEVANNLYLNEGIGIHSQTCKDKSIPIRGYWAYTAAASQYRDHPEETKEICIIGLAGGTMARQVLEAHPGAHVDGVEIDGRIVEVGKQYFDNDDPRITPYVLDGRIFLQSIDKQYDLILVDAYRQPYIPFHLTTFEFWKEARKHLTEDGVVGINVASVRGVDDSLLRMIYKTMRQVFPSIFHVKATRSNDILIATVREKDVGLAWEHLSQARRGTTAALVKRRWRRKIHREVDGWQDARILTDDQAPVEMLWDAAALDFVK